MLCTVCDINKNYELQKNQHSYPVFVLFNQKRFHCIRENERWKVNPGQSKAVSQLQGHNYLFFKII